MSVSTRSPSAREFVHGGVVVKGVPEDDSVENEPGSAGLTFLAVSAALPVQTSLPVGGVSRVLPSSTAALCNYFCNVTV